MNQKVICDRALICEHTDGCDHSSPHEVEIFESRYNDSGVNKCTDLDDCEEHMVRCIPIGIDFDIEELFII